MLDEFKQAYYSVFDEEDNIQKHSKEDCINLIRACNAIEFTNKYGDAELGLINIQAIQSLKKRLMDKGKSSI
jgi:hypothetical protein